MPRVKRSRAPAAEEEEATAPAVAEALSEERTCAEALMMACDERLGAQSPAALMVCDTFLARDFWTSFVHPSFAAASQVWAWGNNLHGQLGLGNKQYISAPTEVTALHGRCIHAVACGNHHTMAVVDDGELWATGHNSSGQLGLGDTTERMTPEPVSALSGRRVAAIACGAFHSVAVLETGELFAWGGTYQGKPAHNRNVPTQVTALAGMRVVAVSGGGNFTAAVLESGELFTWGCNSKGELGHGDATGNNTPQLVEALHGRPVIAVACGYEFTLALLKTGEVFAWGRNDYGQLGLSGGPFYTPQQVHFVDDKRAVSIHCGDFSSGAVLENGTLCTWGSGASVHGVFEMRISGAHVLAADLKTRADLDSYCAAPLPQHFPVVADISRGATLVHAAVVTRHGARTPCNLFPVDDGVAWDVCDGTETTAQNVAGSAAFAAAYSTPKSAFGRAMWRGNCIVGQLTPLGQKQHAALGARMREVLGAYGMQLANASELHVRSTDVWRTKQSAQSHVAGLCPAKAHSSSRSNDKGEQQPVLLHVVPWATETFAPNPAACPRISTLLAAALKTDAWAAHAQAMAPLLKRVSALTGAPASWSAIQSADVVHSRVCHGLKLPCNRDGSDCLTAAEAQQLSAFADWERAAFHGTDEIVRLDLGFWATDELVPNILLANKTGLPKYALYSGHDDTITPLLAAFRLEGLGVWPPFASHVTFEVWRLGQDLLVRIQYNGKLQTISGCSGSNGTVCTWPEFLAIIAARLTITDYAKQCAA